MKRIYAFTLDSDDYLTDRFRFNLRLVAYLMYDAIYNYDGENSTALIINKNIVYNSIREGFGSKEYYLDSDLFDNGYINYEPFLIGKRSFGLTIDDTIMSEDVIYDLFRYTLRLAGLCYNFTINSESYCSKNKDDEKNRGKAIRILHSKLGCQPVKKNFLVKKKILENSSILRRCTRMF